MRRRPFADISSRPFSDHRPNLHPLDIVVHPVLKIRPAGLTYLPLFVEQALAYLYVRLGLVLRGHVQKRENIAQVLLGQGRSGVTR